MSSVAVKPWARRTDFEHGDAARLRRSVMTLSRRLRREGSDGEVAAPLYDVLVELRDGPLTPNQLAARQMVRPPSVTRVVDALAERGLVERVDHPHDRRSVLVRLTPAGESCLVETRQRRTAWLDRQLDELDPDERRVLIEAAPLLFLLATT